MQDADNDNDRSSEDKRDGAVAGGDSPAAAGGCPICGKPVEERWRPFCSRRCADIDLHRWLSGGYAIPAADGPPGDGGDEE